MKQRKKNEFKPTLTASHNNPAGHEHPQLDQDAFHAPQQRSVGHKIRSQIRVRREFQYRVTPAVQCSLVQARRRFRKSRSSGNLLSNENQLGRSATSWHVDNNQGDK